MAETTIEWTATYLPDGRVLPGYTFNPWIGCQAISPACDHCYAEARSNRFGEDFAVRHRTGAANWRLPLKWNREAMRSGIRRKVFCASLADVFDNRVPAGWRADLWALIAATPHLDWLLLTKRPQNIAKMLPLDWGDGWPNVWLGTTVENRVELRRVDHLRAAPATVRFLSCEPLLEDLGDFDLAGISWVIAGGESGAGARTMHPAWARSLLALCVAAGVAFFFKQWGEWAPCQERDGHVESKKERCIAGTWMLRVGKKSAGRMLDGRVWNQQPTNDRLPTAAAAPHRAA